MLGTYENFPKIYHSVSRFSYTISVEKLQRAIIQSLCKLNRKKEGPNLPEFTQYNIEVELELGIADGLTFSYVDREISRDCLERLREKVFQTLDFLCIVRYYAVKKDRRSSLRFDYHILRFLFNEDEVEIRVYHERGTRRLAVEDLSIFLTETINQELATEKLSPLKRTYVRAV